MSRLARLRKPAAVVVSGLAIGAGGAFALGTGSGDEDAYLVRAVFDNASFVIPGEDVKIAGVTVGSIDAVDLTADNKAAVVLKIDDPAFKPFRSDAHCDIGLQSLIGEQFVECTPTAPRASGAAIPPALTEINDGDGQGQFLLPVTNTTTPVGVDLINNIMRLPYRERFRLILGELGVGLAGNGEDLRAALRRASPALGQLNRVVGVLADQNRLLARLTDESDVILKPWARERKAFGGFIKHAGETAEASAQRGDDLEADFKMFPAFLRELKPAADRFSAMADQMTPALAELHSQAPTINESVQRLSSFTKASGPAIVSLGRVADKGRKTFPAINSFARSFGGLAKPLRPLSQDLAGIAGSFDGTGGIESLMRFIYFYTGAVNGTDELGHYIRSYLNLGGCVERAETPALGCEATFDKSTVKASSASARSGSADDQLLNYLLGDEATP
ncbi:MAG: MlaD family protein [Solirubrobacteraceae bacterium]